MVYECDVYKDLKSENILELFYWGFFVENYDKRELNTNLSDEELKWREEFVQNGLVKLEQLMGYKFPEGKTNIVDRFNTKQNVELEHHSLALYTAITLIQIWMNLMLKYYFKFDHEYINDVDMKVWYKNTSKNEQNMTKKNNSMNRNGLLFLHGIGIGFAPYYYFLQALLDKIMNNNDIERYFVWWRYQYPWIFCIYCHGFSSSYITHKLPAKITDYIHVLDVMEQKMEMVECRLDCDWS